MEDTLKFLRDCDLFWSWLRDPGTTTESREKSREAKRLEIELRKLYHSARRLQTAN